MEELKAIQKRAKKILLLVILAGLLFGAIIFIFLSISGDDSVANNLLFSLAPSIAISSAICKVVLAIFNGKLSDVYKSTFVTEALKSTFDNLVFNGNGLDRSIIRDTGMMSMGNRFSSNDYISATYKNVNFEQADVYIAKEEEYRDKDGDTHTKTTIYLRGKWLIFDFNKTFAFNFRVKDSRFGHAALNTAYGEPEYSQVQLEDAEFNNMFKVHAQNAHDVFYVLTPQLITKIKRLRKRLNCSLMLCFIDNKMHVALANNKDSFECKVFESLDENTLKKRVLHDIRVITSFVDELNLEANLFKQ